MLSSTVNLTSYNSLVIIYLTERSTYTDVKCLRKFEGPVFKSREGDRGHALLRTPTIV